MKWLSISLVLLLLPCVSMENHRKRKSIEGFMPEPKHHITCDIPHETATKLEKFWEPLIINAWREKTTVILAQCAHIEKVLQTKSTDILRYSKKIIELNIASLEEELQTISSPSSAFPTSNKTPEQAASPYTSPLQQKMQIHKQLFAARNFVSLVTIALLEKKIDNHIQQAYECGFTPAKNNRKSH